MKALLFLRYIDGIFTIWNGIKEELLSVIDELNKKYKTIRFDYKVSTHQIEFLDIMVYKDQQHKIQTTIFRKPTDQQTYTCNPKSNHPKSRKNSIPYSQTLRIKTICSTIFEFNKNYDSTTKGFKGRGYYEKLINSQIDKVKNIKRKQLLSTNKGTMQKRIPVSITYNRYLPNISIITKNWSILQLSPTLLKIFDDKPMITYIEQIHILIEQIDNKN